MRITRSTLRRLIAEESARLLREAAFPEEIEAQYGRGRGGEEEEEERGTRMLHVTYHGGAYEGGEGFSNLHFIVTDYDANPMGEEAEDVTAEITGGEDVTALESAYALKDWLLSHTEVGYVVDEEMHDPETDDNSTAEEYLENLDGVIASQEDEAGERGAEMYMRAVDRADYGDLDEADKGPSPLEAAEGRLRAAIKDFHPTKASSLTKRILDLIDDVMMEEAISAEADGTDEFPFNASVKVLEQMGDTFPGDADLEELHAAIDAVIKPQWRGALESAAEAESDRRDVEDTERDLSHPSRFLQEYGDPNDSDPDGGFMGGMASDEEMDYLRGGGSYSDSPYADNDVPDNRYTRGRAKGFNREPRVRGDDIDSGYDDDMMGDDNLSEGEDLSESIDMLSAGIGAIVGIAALYAAGPLSRVAYNILDELSYQQQQAARAAASKEAGSKLAAAIENLSHDKDLIALFEELEDLQKSEEKGTSAKIIKKSKEITAYIKGKRKDMSFGSGDEQDVRRGVSKRLKKGDDDKGDKLDEGRWAQLAGILKG